jgi:uncharacterized protein
MTLLLVLFLTGLAAGFVDAIAGGGGLITLPVLLATGLPLQHSLGTNKFQAAFGTAVAVWRYTQAKLVTWQQVRWAVPSTAVGALVGTWAITQLSAEALAPIVPWLLLAVALYTLLSPQLGTHTTAPRLHTAAFALTTGPLLGFYDGFFGPGTGAFWTLACLTLLGHSLPQATAFTKAVNLTSNIASMAYFATQGSIRWDIGAIMITGQVIGAQLGSRLVIQHRTALIRRIFLTVVFVLVAHLLLR